MQISYENLCVLFMKPSSSVCDSFRSDDVEIKIFFLLFCGPARCETKNLWIDNRPGQGFFSPSVWDEFLISNKSDGINFKHESSKVVCWPQEVTFSSDDLNSLHPKSFQQLSSVPEFHKAPATLVSVGWRVSLVGFYSPSIKGEIASRISSRKRLWHHKSLAINFSWLRGVSGKWRLSAE